MKRVNLESVAALQSCSTPGRVTAQLERWRRRLECEWANEDPRTGPAAVRMRDVVAESLWRDMFGFIPIYLIFFALGLWLLMQNMNATEVVALRSHGEILIHLWWILPVATAAADLIEDTCQLGYLRIHKAGGTIPLPLTLISSLMTGLKFVGFLVSLMLTIATIVGMNLHQTNGWRKQLALLLALALLVAGLVYAAGKGLGYILKRAPQGHGAGGSKPKAKSVGA